LALGFWQTEQGGLGAEMFALTPSPTLRARSPTLRMRSPTLIF